MKFRIAIYHDRKRIRLSVERVYLDERIERYAVTGRNGSITIESNRPLFRNKGLKNRRPDWKQIEGQEVNKYILEKIIEAVQKEIDKG